LGRLRFRAARGGEATLPYAEGAPLPAGLFAANSLLSRA